MDQTDARNMLYRSKISICMVKSIGVAFFLSALFISCDDKTEFDDLGNCVVNFSNNVQSFEMLDLGNSNTPEDFQLRITLSEVSSIEEMKVAIFETANAEQLGVAVLSELPDQYFSFFTDLTEEMFIRLSPEQVIAGDTDFSLNVFYSARIFLKVDNEWLPASRTHSILNSAEHYLSGDYFGTWDDNLYKDVPIRATLKVQGSILSGEFRFLGGFSYLYQGTPDGIMSMTVQNESLRNFVYQQYIQKQPDQPSCSGLYNGQGVVEDFTILLIDFEGYDCNGTHADGRIRLERQL